MQHYDTYHIPNSIYISLRVLGSQFLLYILGGQVPQGLAEFYELKTLNWMSTHFKGLVSHLIFSSNLGAKNGAMGEHANHFKGAMCRMFYNVHLKKKINE